MSDEPMSNAQREELLAACTRARADVKRNAASMEATARESLRRLRREHRMRYDRVIPEPSIEKINELLAHAVGEAAGLAFLREQMRTVEANIARTMARVAEVEPRPTTTP